MLSLLLRAVSDGAFAASVSDVAVLPRFQRRRIGRQLMQRLVKTCLARGAASCVVFPLPRDRVSRWPSSDPQLVMPRILCL